MGNKLRRLGSRLESVASNPFITGWMMMDTAVNVQHGQTEWAAFFGTLSATSVLVSLLRKDESKPAGDIVIRIVQNLREEAEALPSMAVIFGGIVAVTELVSGNPTQAAEAGAIAAGGIAYGIIKLRRKSKKEY